jgi:hypothetical protein
MNTCTHLNETRISAGLSLLTYSDDATGLIGYEIYRLNIDGSYAATAGPYISDEGFESEAGAISAAISAAKDTSIQSIRNLIKRRG